MFINILSVHAGTGKYGNVVSPQTTRILVQLYSKAALHTWWSLSSVNMLLTDGMRDETGSSPFLCPDCRCLLQVDVMPLRWFITCPCVWPVSLIGAHNCSVALTGLPPPPPSAPNMATTSHSQSPAHSQTTRSYSV